MFPTSKSAAYDLWYGLAPEWDLGFCNTILEHPILCDFLRDLVTLPEPKKIKYKKLDGQGRARREAARRRNFECKINLISRNYSRRNGSRPTAVQRAVIGRRRGELVAAPRRRPVSGKEGVSEGDSI